MDFDKKEEMKFLEFLFENRNKDLTKTEIRNEISPEIGNHKFEELFTEYETKGLFFQHITNTKGEKLYSLSNVGKDYYTHLLQEEKYDKKIRWPQIYWWFIPTVTFILGVCFDIVKKTINQKLLPESNQLIQATPKDTGNHQIQKMATDSSLNLH